MTKRKSCKTFRQSSRDIKGRPRSRAVRLRIILAFLIALIYYTQDFSVYEGTRDQPMPGPFPAPPICEGKSPGNEVGCLPLQKKKMENGFLCPFIGKFPGATKHLKKWSCSVFPGGMFVLHLIKLIFDTSYR